jgi:predicted thioesterase
MKDTLTAGLTSTVHYEIDERRVIGFMGEEGRVYATPELVRDIENTCRNLLLPHLDAGEDSVGIRVELDHTAATPFGMWVEITATLTALDGRRAQFEVVAHDPVEPVARASHARFIVDVNKTLARLKKKVER